MSELIDRVRELRAQDKSWAEVGKELGVDGEVLRHRFFRARRRDGLVAPPGEGYSPARVERQKHPTGWEPGIDTARGIIVAAPSTSRDVSWDEEIRKLGLDPKEFEVVEPYQIRTWEGFYKGDDGKAHKVQLWYRKANIIRRRAFDDRVDIEALTKLILAAPVPPALQEGEQAFIFVWADAQIGKGDGDGTPGIIERMTASLDSGMARLEELRASGRKIGLAHLHIAADLYESTAGHYCVAADTPILTDDLRWIPAGALMPGDGLYAFSEEVATRRGRRYRKATVLANAIEEMEAVRITFDDGSELIATPQHPLLTSGSKATPGLSRWMNAEELTPGIRVAKIATPWVTGETYDHGWLAGLYDGEGSFSAGRERTGPNVLGIAQLPGLVLEKAKDCLKKFGFKYSELVNSASGVASLRIRGGYAECLRLLGTVRPGRLLPKLGEPYTNSTWVRVTRVESAGVQRIARLGTSTHTYFANGFASHNSMQTFMNDLNLREQRAAARRLVLAAVSRFAQTGLKVLVTVVPGNHTENRLNGKAYTTFGDSGDVEIVEQVAEICAANPSAYGNVRFVIPKEEMELALDICGTIVGLAHGHQMKQGVEKWWREQAMNRQPIGDADILITGHKHSAGIWRYGDRWHFQAPTLESESTWYKHTHGDGGHPAVMTVVTSNHRWSDFQLL